MTTPTTSKTVEHLRIGDQVHIDGAIRTVHAVWPRRLTNDRTVHFTDGTVVTLPDGTWCTVTRPEPDGDQLFEGL